MSPSNPFNSKHHEPEIKFMLKICLENANDEISEFVESLNDQWTERGTLSEKQYHALERIFERTKID